MSRYVIPCEYCGENRWANDQPCEHCGDSDELQAEQIAEARMTYEDMKQEQIKSLNTPVG